MDSAIIDGEAVVLDERGAADFAALQKAFGGRGGSRASAKAILYTFDLLYLNGHDLRPLGCGERRGMLADVLNGSAHGAIRLSDRGRVFPKPSS
ncbi:ATP-dependent DNA ligase [Rhizobium mesoamericanum]|uniref:ATP-dependent DNA ligase n=1 Tax=Rhizobium mesoamericanum TaxID=1079800 RepID=UPI003521BE52